MAKATPKLTDLETETDSAPSAIPAGVPADVTVKYKTQVDPNSDSTRARRFNNELYELAEEAINERALEDTAHPLALELDPLSQFCLDWRNYTGWLMKVTRLPDPANRRMPGQQYARPCFEIESLGATPFDPVNPEGTLQIINGNSGGVFRVWLVDENGYPVEHEGTPARVDRVVIGDPAYFGGRVEAQQNRYSNARSYDIDSNYQPRSAPTPAPPPQKSETERELDEIKSNLFRTVLERAINPPPPPPPPGDGLTAEDRVGLYILNNGGLIPALMEKMTAIAGAPDAAAVKETLGERTITAAMKIAETNPALVERLSDTMYAIVDRILPNTRTPVIVAPNLPTPPVQHHPPGQRANPAIAQPTPNAPVASWQNPDEDSEDSADLDDESDAELMDILDSIFELLTDTRPFAIDDPVVVQLRQTHPVKFRMALQLIATQPIEDLIQWIASQSTLYEKLLTSAVTAPHYRARLLELQAFCKAPPQPVEPNAETADNAPSPTP